MAAVYGEIECGIMCCLWGHLDVGRSGSQMHHYSDVTMNTIVSQIRDVSISCSFVCSGAHQRKHKKKLRVTGLCEGTPPVTGGLPSLRASDAEDVPIIWRRHVKKQAMFDSISDATNLF